MPPYWTHTHKLDNYDSFFFFQFLDRNLFAYQKILSHKLIMGGAKISNFLVFEVHFVLKTFVENHGASFDSKIELCSDQKRKSGSPST
jgi:hypothetical protein